MSLGVALVWAWLAVGAAGAQDDPSAEDVPVVETVSGDGSSEDQSSEDDEEGIYTVVVVAERRVEMARQKLYETAREAGFTRVREKDDRVILRHDQAWKGDIVVHDDGQVEVKRQPMRFEPPVKNPRPIDYLWCVLVPICVRPAGQIYNKRKWKSAEARALATVRPEVEVLQSRIAELGLARKVEDLPPRLEALWTEGVALDGGKPIASMADRRAAIAAFWSSRTDTPEGRLVRDTLQAYVRNEVQYSDHPFTPDEIRAINASSRHPEPFLPRWAEGGSAW